MAKAKKTEMEITQVNPSILLPNPWNSNRLTPEGEKQLETSLERFGFIKPVIAREIEVAGKIELQIIGGEHRSLVAKRKGYKTVPVVNLGPIDDKRAKEISLVDNARYGADDATDLAALLTEIGNIAEIQTFMPFTDDDVTSIFSAASIDLEELNLDEEFDLKVEEQAAQIEAAKPTKTPKTHTIMRFKVSIPDAERIAKRVADTKIAQGFTSSDELTNAGDALSHLLLAATDGA